MKFLKGDSGVGFHNMVSEPLMERFDEYSLLLGVRGHVALRFSVFIFIFKGLFIFMCMVILFACVFVHYMHACMKARRGQWIP